MGGVRLSSLPPGFRPAKQGSPAGKPAAAKNGRPTKMISQETR